MPDTTKSVERRKRRTHTKSRQGCRNCKIRRVKCDETRPRCRNCHQYSVACNFTQGPDLEIAWQGLAKVRGNKPAQLVFNATPMPNLSSSITIGEGTGSFILDPNSQARLHRFYHRTLPTIGTQRVTEVYQKEAIRLAIAHPFLMHIMLSIATTHDRHLLPPTLHSESILISTESSHRAQAANLLNKKLSNPILPQDRDALWAAAAMLGISVITTTEASEQESWPLKISQKPFDSRPVDLQWMDFSINKKAIWNLTNPLRPDSVFHVLADSFGTSIVQPRLCSVDEMAREFVDLCGFNSDIEFNPYFGAVSMLTRMRDGGLGIRSSPWDLCVGGALPGDLCFIAFMEPAFKALLGERDERALLILAFWYAPLCRGVWWMARRAWVECRAICLFLEDCSDGLVGRLLDVVRARCGL